MNFLVRFLISALGLWIAASLISGLGYRDLPSLLLAALLLGLVNAVVRPVLIVLTFPLTLVTFGLFLLVVNAAMLGLVGAMLRGFVVDGFWPAVFGSIVISLTSWIANQLLETRTRSAPGGMRP